ncbi:MAG: hypothetical protein Fur0043_01870 [Anaerolineales bacterium]
MKRLPYLPFVALAILALVFGLWAGLLRIGWALPAPALLAAAHGPLMVFGFLGVLIPLERAVAIRQKWMFAVPLVAGAGWIGLLFSPGLGALLLTLGSVGTLCILSVMVKREPHIHTWTMFAGALVGVIGNLLWLGGRPIFQVVFLWMTFLVLTIGGERLELNRLLRPTAGQIRLFLFLSVALGMGSLLALYDLPSGSRLSGAAFAGLALWFLRFDLASRNIRHPNSLTRYIAICLFGGYFWLLLAGGLFLYHGVLAAGPFYDAALHALFVGFVFAMIFGHAPIIFPAIWGTQARFFPVFYLHLVLLHLSLVLRLSGDLTFNMDWRRWGGLFNETAIVLFLTVTRFSLLRKKT